MSDSQWRRYQVFEQRREGAPHENAGSLHAPDNEIALQMARDIFVRRPTCIDLWVAPADAIFARSAEQLADPAWRENAGPQSEAESIRYRVFAKTRHAGTHGYLGVVEAAGPAAALEQAIDAFADSAVLVWWVVPDAAFTETNPDDAASLFAPARDKTYRDQADYQTVSLMRNIRHAQAERSSEE